MNSREKQIIERTRKSLLHDGFIEVPINEKSQFGMGDYISFFDLMIDRRLEGLDQPSPEEVFVNMKRQINYLNKIILDVGKDYTLLSNKYRDLQVLCNDLLREGCNER